MEKNVNNNRKQFFQNNCYRIYIICKIPFGTMFVLKRRPHFKANIADIILFSEMKFSKKLRTSK